MLGRAVDQDEHRAEADRGDNRQHERSRPAAVGSATPCQLRSTCEDDAGNRRHDARDLPPRGRLPRRQSDHDRYYRAGARDGGDDAHRARRQRAVEGDE